MEFSTDLSKLEEYQNLMASSIVAQSSEYKGAGFKVSFPVKLDYTSIDKANQQDFQRSY